MNFMTSALCVQIAMGQARQDAYYAQCASKLHFKKCGQKKNQAKIFHSLSRYIAVLHARKQVQKEKALLSVDNKKFMNVECCLKRKLKQTKTKHKVPRILRKVNPTRQVQ